MTQCRMAIALCFFPNTAMRVGEKGAYRAYKEDVLIGDHSTWLWIHPSSSLRTVLPKWVVYQELVFTSKAFIRQICAIEYAWVEHLLPRLKSANINRLAGRSITIDDKKETTTQEIKSEHPEIKEEQSHHRVHSEQDKDSRDTSSRAETARERYLQRKKVRDTEGSQAKRDAVSEESNSVSVETVPDK